MFQKVFINITKMFLGVAILVQTANAQAQTPRYKSSTGTNVTATKSENKKTGFDVNRLIYGGGLYGGGGNQMISLGVSPIIGYAITDFWSAGISLGYKYNYSKDFFSVYNYDWQKYEYFNLNNHIFVPGLWTRLKVFRNFFTHFEFEQVVSTYMLHENDNAGKYTKNRISEGIPCLLLGAGIKQPVTENSSFVIYALYDVLQNIPSNIRNINGVSYSMSPYARTLDIRVGLNIGF